MAFSQAFFGKVDHRLSGQGMNGVNIDVTTDQGESGSSVTDPSHAPLFTDGGFNFIFSQPFATYNAFVEKPASWMDGVSTLDIVLISKHILLYQPFVDGFQWIAADTNHDADVSTADLVALRKLILGINNSLSDWDRPWQFVPAHVYDLNGGFFNNGKLSTKDMTGVLGSGAKGYPEWLEKGFDIPLFEQPVGELSNKNGFYGVKIGDVSGNASIKPSALTTISFEDENTSLLKDKSYELKINLSELPEKYAGFQFGAKFNSDNVIIENISSNLQNFDKNSYSIDDKNGELKILWYAEKLNEFHEKPTITLRVKVKESTSLVESFQIDENILTHQFIGVDADITYYKIVISALEKVDNINAPILGAFPNPMTNELTIRFNNTNNNSVNVSIVDMSGRIMQNITTTDQSLNIDVSSLVSGTYICKVTTSNAVTQQVVVKR